MIDSHKQFFPLSCLFLVLVLLLGQMGLQAQATQLKYPFKMIFGFGDSYIDNGNNFENVSDACKVPFGMPYPGKPAGRFADGKILRDFLVPYQFRNEMPQYLKHGMNFAYGGTSIFKTHASLYPNMTVQINFLEQLVKEKVYYTSYLKSSLALISMGTNDYKFYLMNDGPPSGYKRLIAAVVNPTIINISRIQKLGMKTIVVASLQPLGCVPQVTGPTYQRCNSTYNKLIVYHNKLMNQSLTKLNQQSKDPNTFIYLELFESMMAVLKNPTAYNLTKEPLKPCCAGISSEYTCGSVENNVKKYTVCENPKSAFYWALLHPAQGGWNAVYHKLTHTKALR